MNKSFWKGKRVLITGHTGFKGSWLALWLKSRGADVSGYSLDPPTTPNLFSTAGVGRGIASVIGDVRDLENLCRVFSRHSPEIVFHMAAQSLVRRSYLDPVETFGSNVMGTVNVLEAVRRADSVRVLVNITSDKCYENREWPWGYRENDPMGGRDPYSSSKGCAELVTAAYRQSYFSGGDGRASRVAVATTRAGNVIGGGDWAMDRLIPDIMRAILEGRPALIRNPEAVRPWQHVLEPLGGYMVLAERLWERGAEFAGGWNFGPGDDESYSVAWIAERLTALWGDGAGYVLDKDRHPHEALCLKLDCSKSRGLLGWSPRLKLPVTLEWIVEWYRAFGDKKDMELVTMDQISRYDKTDLVGPSDKRTYAQAL